MAITKVRQLYKGREVAVYASIPKAAKALGVNSNALYRCYRGEQEQVEGFDWEFEEGTRSTMAPSKRRYRTFKGKCVVKATPETERPVEIYSTVTVASLFNDVATAQVYDILSRRKGRKIAKGYTYFAVDWDDAEELAERFGLDILDEEDF